MKRLGFAYNATNETALGLRERAAGWCGVRGIETWSAPSIDLDALCRELPSTDALVVLGGDGTFLNAARAVGVVDVPILGINSGKVGFLSKAEPEQLESVLQSLLDGAYGFELRMALEARLLHGRTRDAAEPRFALNDAAIVRGSSARVVRLSVAIDGSHLATYIADGLVVATPTGSTAYSFSAGGPILDPTSQNLIVTPVAAYMSAIRSVVVSPRHVVRIEIVDARDVLVSIDGREDLPLETGDVVEVRSRERLIRFIDPRGATAFWQLLRHKAELLPS